VALSTGTKRLGRKPDQSLPLIADVTNGWRYALKPPICIHGTDKDDFTFTMGLQHSANSASLFLCTGATFLSGFLIIPCIFHVSNLQFFSLHPEACSFADLITYVSAATSHFHLRCFQTTPCTSSPKPSSRFAILLLSPMLHYATITSVNWAVQGLPWKGWYSLVQHVLVPTAPGRYPHNPQMLRSKDN